jgi:hypothetical protein
MSPFILANLIPVNPQIPATLRSNPTPYGSEWQDAPCFEPNFQPYLLIPLSPICIDMIPIRLHQEYEDNEGGRGRSSWSRPNKSNTEALQTLVHWGKA